MAQLAKFIDVTRTFVPIDPNAFPESLHVSAQADASPEAHVPVMAYKGYNFMPTSYGYKSYFGINQSLGIDALTARVDNIFIYQNKAYENVLIALTESGIWVKQGEEAGGWVNTIPVVPNVDPTVHFEWTFTIIADILYAYQQGAATYQTIEHSPDGGVTITSVTPNFLNMQAQVGIFRAAGRLAFWDSDESIGWANLDDFADFEPSLETLAGNARFSDIQGRIVTIKSHGEGFIIYATKSVIHIAQALDNTFQWNPTVILSSTGVTYPKQVAVGSPDTIHFAYTSEGMKKIERAREETIVPEVTDTLGEAQDPVYLQVIGGRYLFLELLDSKYVTGTVQLTEEIIPPTDYNFPGSTTTAEAAIDKYPDEPCMLVSGVTNGNFPDTLPSPKPVDQHPTDKSMKPVWTCYLSRNGVLDAENITWGPGACPTVDPNGVEANMSPDAPTLDSLGATSANKTAVTGDEAYTTGGWTMERFMAAQSAIWELEDQARAEVIQKITNRAKIVTKETFTSGVCNAVPVARDECTLGRFPSEFSAPVFGYSVCSFWMTRFATAAIDLVRVKATDTLCQPNSGYIAWAITSGNHGASSRNAAIDLAFAGWFAANPGWVYAPDYVALNYDWAVDRFTFGAKRTSDGTLTQITDTQVTVATRRADNMYAYNKGIDVEIDPTIDQPYCEITGWEYTTTTGEKAVVANNKTCSAPAIYPKPGTGTGTTGLGGGNVPIAKDSGALCGKPYETPLSPFIPTIWPNTSVTIPGGTFFLQRGSIAPVYHTSEGALVYDLQLKKWGKMKQRYKLLLDYSPINSTLNGVVPANVFGIHAGVLRADGKINLFDMFPRDSYISYGKVGYYRLGNTSPEEVRVDFRIPCTGYVKVETSLDGSGLSSELVKVQPFTDAIKVILYGAYPGRWANIEIGGIFDINYLEYRGFTQGRR